MAEAELVKVVAYIKDRAEQLSRYSDKLRQSVCRIFNIFGPSSLCQLCNEVEDDPRHHHYRWEVNQKKFEDRDEAVKWVAAIYPHREVKEVEEHEHVGRWRGEDVIYLRKLSDTFQHPFTPRINAGVNIRDQEPFYVEDETKYFLVLSDYGKKLQIEVQKNDLPPRTWRPEEIRRKVLMELVKSGRLIEFFNVIKRVLNEKVEEYGEVAEIAEKLTKSVTLKNVNEQT